MYTLHEHDRFWRDSALGKALYEEECRQLERVLPTLFGLYSLQLGTQFTPDCFSASSIKHHMQMSLTDSREQSSSLYGYAEDLPFASESLDLVILPHVLENSENPHAVLREADRSLVRDGHILIFGLNPWSYWQAWRWLRHRGRGYPWAGRYYSRGRLTDWLALLGFEICESRYFFLRPPLNHHAVLAKTTWLEEHGQPYLQVASAAYMILARKRMQVITPIRQRSRPSRVFGVSLSPP